MNDEKKLNIIIVCKTFFKGGAEKQALIFARLLQEKGVRIKIISLQKNSIDKSFMNYLGIHSIKFIEISGPLISKLLKLCRIINEENVNIIFSYLTLANFITGMIKLFNKDVITIGGIRNEKLPLLKFMVEKFVHNYLNDATVFNNYSAKEKFIGRGFKSSKIHVVHNSIESIQLKNKSITNEEKLVIVSVARFVKQKDYKTAIFAIRKFADRNPNKLFEYRIVGYGKQEKKIKSMIRQLKMEEKIKILDETNDIPKILSEADIYLSTSLFEGLSNSILEALSAALPVIATKVGDNHFMVRDGFNGFLVPCGNSGMIAEKIDFLSENETIRKQFGLNSRKILEEKFTEEIMIFNYCNIISELLKAANKTTVVNGISLINKCSDVRQIGIGC